MRWHVITVSTRPFLVLRQRTAVIHRQLEARLNLLSPSLDLGHHVDTLRRLATVHAPLERQLAPFEADPELATIAIAGRRRLPALAADLTALGSELPAVDHPVPALTSRAAVLGALYVTEGATLGGAMIAAHVRQVLGPDTPTGFFGGDPDAATHRWTEFRRAATPLLARPDDVERAAEAAAAVFAAFAGAVG